MFPKIVELLELNGILFLNILNLWSEMEFRNFWKWFFKNKNFGKKRAVFSLKILPTHFWTLITPLAENLRGDVIWMSKTFFFLFKISSVFVQWVHSPGLLSLNDVIGIEKLSDDNLHLYGWTLHIICKFSSLMWHHSSDWLIVKTFSITLLLFFFSGDKRLGILWKTCEHRTQQRKKSLFIL